MGLVVVVAAALTLMVTAVLVMNIVAVSLAETTTLLCNDNVYSEKHDHFAADIDEVLRVLGDTGPGFLRDIDENVYSPRKDTPVAFGKRQCAKKDDDLGVSECEWCFNLAYKLLSSYCRNNHQVGGQVTFEFCCMRYEIYDFLH